MMELRTSRFLLVPVILDATAAAGRVFNLPDQDDLRGAIIEAIETFDATDLTDAPQGEGSIVSAADSARLVLSVAHESNDRISFLPYRPARAVLLGGNVRRFTGWSVSWVQSTLRVVQALGADTPTVALIGVHFRYASDRV